MIIDLRKMKYSGKREESFFFEYTPKENIVDLPDAVLVAPVKVEGTVELTDNHAAIVDAEIFYQIQGNCTRCLEPTSKDYVVEFTEDFESGNDDSYPVVNDRIDLSKVVEDKIIMNLPISFLCKDDCKGLCPNCGANLNNEGECKCK